MQWTFALSIEKADPAKPNILRLKGKKLCLWKKGRRWFAFDLRCPHEGYPLSQGDVDEACVLTCRWHNWRFRLEDGKTLRGEDKLRTYPLKIQDGALWIDLTDEPEDVRRQTLLSQFQRHFKNRYYGAMARVLANWDSQGFDLKELHLNAIRWTLPHLERGFSHSQVGLIEWVSFSQRFSETSARLACHLEAFDFQAEDAYGQEEYPFPLGSITFQAQEFQAALENEDEAKAMAMARSFLQEDGAWPDLEAHLAHFVFHHYLGYGHGAIYLSKLPSLLEYLGPDSRELIILAFVRYIIVAVRDEMLPEFKRYPLVLDAIQHALNNPFPNQEIPEPPPLASTLAQAWKWLEKVSKTHAFEPIMQSLVLASAHNLLSFDSHQFQEIAVKPKDHFTWLDLTHAITFAEASIKLSQQYLWIKPAVLVQMTAFIGRVHHAIHPDLSHTLTNTPGAKYFRTWVESHILNHGETENIYPVHRLKTFLAVESLERFLPPKIQDVLRAGLYRYLTEAFPKKFPQRTLFQAMDHLKDYDS